MNTIEDFKMNQRIELSPSTDQWMMGARFGNVVKLDTKTGLVHVRMDKLRKVLKCQPDHILKINPETDHGFHG
jgi:ribosomal protein L21E